MEQIIIRHKDGTETPLFSRKRPSAISRATQKIALLADDVVTVSVTTSEPLPLSIGDTAVIYGRTYKLNQLPEPTKTGERRFSYELRLEGLQYDLIDVHYHLPEEAYGETYYANLQGHLTVLLWNINRLFPGKWVLGDFPKDTDFKNITNTGKNALQVLQELCSEYEVEFSISTTGTTNRIDVKPTVGITHAFTLKFGRGKGLYQLSRGNVNNAGITNRLYAYGSSENLGTRYRHEVNGRFYPNNRLCLPGTNRLTSYVEDTASIQAYGVKESEKTYDIKPQRVGTVTALGSDNITFADSEMFDLNKTNADGSTAYLIDGASAKIKFESGELAGYEFDLHSYDHATKTFIINKFQDENGLIFPSEEASGAFRIAIGDKYSILDIQLPQEYIESAEADLAEAAGKDLPTMSQPQVNYKLSVTEGFFKAMFGSATETEVLHVGDYIPISDPDIGVDKAVRITALERDILKPHSYQITLSDTVTKTITTKVINDINEINEIITINKLADPTKARRRWMATQELLNMVFDPEGDYYTEKIKPLSIETQMLSVGAKSTQFTLLNVMFQPNYGGNPNTVVISNGILAHYAIDPDAVKLWYMTGATYSGLATSTAYYIYARCDRNGAGGTFILSPTPITVEQEANVYNFLVGVVNSVVTDTGGKNPGRLISLTYGSTTINGRFIRTGRIESSGGGSCYFDLDNNEIGGVIKFVDAEGNYKNVTDVDALTQETDQYINNTLPGILGGLSRQIDGKIDTWYQTTDPSTAWTTTELRQQHVGDMWYNSQTNELKRYSASFAWELITDAKAIAAYAAASQAQDTADGKRRVFTSTPYPPYDEGDLWVNATYGSYVNELLRCVTPKAEGGAFNIGDWTKATKYTDNTELDDFIQNTYNQTVAEIQAQLDGQIEQFFDTYDPTLENEPAASWSANEKELHLGDLFYNTDNGKVFRFVKVSGNYQWQQLQDEELAQALVLAQNAYDLADGKRRIFASTPFTPYDAGDLWVQGVNGDIMVCRTARATGNFVISDWYKASKYTDDSALNTFVNTTFTNAIGNLTQQIDGKVETWFTSSDPATDWTTDTEKEKHIDDIWYNTSAKTLWHYTRTDVPPNPNTGTAAATVYSWERITDQDTIDAYEAASHAQDTADGKRRVFTATPVPPYDAGDLWVQGGSGDILVCIIPRAEGATYRRSDWANASKYTDDSALNDFIENTYADNLSDIEDQIDGKIESWFQSTDPATNWTTAAEKAKHVGDMWYNTSSKYLFRYVKRSFSYTNQTTGVTTTQTLYAWSRIQDQDAIDAYDAASNAQDTADRKRQVFTATPYPPYDVGDLWLKSYTDNGVAKKELWRCITGRASGSYNVNDWAEAVYYDNTKTTIDGGIVTSGTVQLAGSDAAIKAGITGEGTAESSVRIWAGATFGNRASAPFRVLQDGSFVASKGNITGEINANTGTIGGFTIGSGRIGTTATATGSSQNAGLSLYDTFIKFADSYANVLMGTNVLPATLGGVRALLRLENKQTSTYSPNYGAIIDVTGGLTNFALAAKGAIVSDSYVESYGFATINPAVNTCHIPGDLTTPTLFRIRALFTYSNSGIGLPSRYSVATKLGISSTASFAVRMVIFCDAASTQTGFVIGRNSIITSTSGSTTTYLMNNSNYPYRLNNNGGTETGKWNMAKGDIREFMLVYDGTNYYAYLLNIRE